MKHNYLSNEDLKKVKEVYFGHIKNSGFGYKEENINVQQSSGRMLSQAVYAHICSPHYNASAMDGVAVKAEDTFGASESNPVVLTPGMYTVVDTGDLLPENCDSVIMVEDLTEEGDEKLSIISAVHPWQNVRQVGEDICMGDMIAPSFTKITPSLCGAFLAGGVIDVNVIKMPLVAIIPTGDEIVSPTSDPQKGKIIEFNSTIFSSMLTEWGAESKVYPIVKDKKDLLKAAIDTAAKECDIVLVLAGSSAGRDDYTSTIISELGRVLFHGIAIKPGKPAVLGSIGNIPVVGIPGYPVSGIVVMEEIVSEVIALYYGLPKKQKEKISAVLGKRVVSSLKYREYVRVTLGKMKDGFVAVPLPRGAGVITSFTKADGILTVPQNSEGFDVGEVVDIELLKDKNKIENALIVTGSHDPLIDEISDITARRGYDFTMASSHVGSMGAITAIRNKQAHLGCIHLLDTADGTYNESYVKKFFPEGGVRLVKGIGRTQGLIVKKGNPLDIRNFCDITKGRYVNRQAGSGTRILCDYLIKANGMDKANIDGYRNEEFTHTGVAALIAAGNADCGLGIYSAAKMYGLDFVELCVEEYDILIDENAFETEKVQKFLEVFHSNELKERLTEMGGYTFG